MHSCRKQDLSTVSQQQTLPPRKALLSTRFRLNFAIRATEMTNFFPPTPAPSLRSWLNSQPPSQSTCLIGGGREEDWEEKTQPRAYKSAEEIFSS